MKIIFIAGPLRGDGSTEAKLANIELARSYVARFIEREIPFYSPHLNLSQESLKFEEDKSHFAIRTHNLFLHRTDALAVLPGWQQSPGTLDEVEHAERTGKTVFFLEEEDVFSKIEAYVHTP